ncbi:MAG: hypothetical protein FWF10_11115 [Clostridiales bacterium]|nr:hypothetical protein [Clostridiales bacterium]
MKGTPAPMPKLTTLCISLCAVGVAFAISEQLLPDGDLKKTAHICMGLLYLALVTAQVRGMFS